MTDMVKLNDQELENAVGGRTVTVQNSASPYTNLRAKAGLKSFSDLRTEICLRQPERRNRKTVMSGIRYM